MGYSISYCGGVFRIKRANFEPCLEAVKKAARDFVEAGKKRSGISHPHWSWMDMDELQTQKTLPDFFQYIGWPVEVYRRRGITGITFDGEKLGSEDEIFQIMAPYVDAGSYIEVQGEDDTRWRWIFDGSKMMMKEATLDWNDSCEVVNALLEQKGILPTLIGIHPALDMAIARSLKGEP